MWVSTVWSSDITYLPGVVACKSKSDKQFESYVEVKNSSKGAAMGSSWIRSGPKFYEQTFLMC